MKLADTFQEFSIQIIIISVIGSSLLAVGPVTTSVYASVKITSPAQGQHVPLGNIVISGISSSNSTNHCTVSVIINGIRPYQQATSTGSNGPSDYSNWTFTATPQYSTIKEGINKITAKYSCTNVNLKRFYSVNVTGVAAKVQSILPTTANHASVIVNEFKHSKILRSAN